MAKIDWEITKIRLRLFWKLFKIAIDMALAVVGIYMVATHPMESNMFQNGLLFLIMAGMGHD